MEKKEEKIEGKVPLWTSCRVLLSIVSFFGFINVYAMRINISVAMVCMVKRGNDSGEFGNWTNSTMNSTALPTTLTYDTCGILEKSESSVADRGEFGWDKDLIGMMLSSFFYGYIVTQIPGGWLAGRFGGRHVFGTAMCIYCAMALLIPVAARTHPYLVIAARVIMGLATGVVFPAMHAIWGKWAPPLERSKLMSFCYSGTIIGNILALSLSGVLCEYGFDNGWPSIFYVFGGFCFLWLVVWYYCVYDSPSKHPRITQAEKVYIESAIGDSVKQKRVPIPWLKFVTSPAVWAIIIAHICNNWGNYTLMTSLPAYMKEVLKFDIKQNGFWSALPYVAMFVTTIAVGQIADLLRQKKILGTTAVRKVFQSIGGFIPAAFMIGTGFVDCTNRMVGVALLTIAVAATAGVRAGFQVNHVDIAPRFAGELYGISNTVATIPGMISPSIVAALTPNKTHAEWQNVFWISGAVYTFGALFYLIFGSGEQQKWAIIKDDEKDIEKPYPLSESQKSLESTSL